MSAPSLAGRFQEAQRQGFGHDGHEEALVGVDDLGAGLEVLDDAEEVRRLDEEPGHVGAHLGRAARPT